MRKYLLVILVVLTNSSSYCFCDIYQDVRNYFTFLCYNPDFTYITNSNTRNTMINFGRFFDVTITRYEISEIIKFGIGYQWDNKDCELYTNLLLMRDRRKVHYSLLVDSVGDEYMYHFSEFRYSEIQFGYTIFDYYKDAIYERKINWFGLSADIIYDEWKTRHGGYIPKTSKKDISPLMMISPFIGFSNIIYSDLFSTFDKGLRNNNFGIEAKLDVLAGFLLFRELFIGFKGKVSSFYSVKLPFNETSYGCKILYSNSLSNSYGWGGKSHKDLYLDIYANWNYTNFFYSKRSINAQIFNIGLVLY